MFDYGDKGDNFYIILEGVCSVVVPVLMLAEPSDTFVGQDGKLVLATSR